MGRASTATDTRIQTLVRGRDGRLAAILAGALEAMICAAGFVGYNLARGSVAGDPDVATEHGARVIGIERALHLFWEPWLQAHLVTSRGVAQFWNDVYLWLHLPLVIFTLVYLYLRHREAYRVIRNVFFLSAAIGLVCYARYPVAPPRLMPGYGFTDTIARLQGNAFDLRPRSFVNEYAAVPSLHCGWAFMIALAFWQTHRHWLVRALAVIEAVGMVAAVVLTANHFFFDAAVGIGVVLFSLLAVRAVQAWAQQRQERAVMPAPVHVERRHDLPPRR
jgi:hypothetical protein